MAKEIWMIEANMDSINPLEFRVKPVEEMLKTNAARVLLKAGELPTKPDLGNWITIGMANNEKEANEKLERFKEMASSERAHAASTGKSLYLKL